MQVIVKIPGCSNEPDLFAMWSNSEKKELLAICAENRVFHQMLQPGCVIYEPIISVGREKMLLINNPMCLKCRFHYIQSIDLCHILCNRIFMTNVNEK